MKRRILSIITALALCLSLCPAWALAAEGEGGLCPIEDLIAALPDEVTPDNAEEVRGQLEEILALYRELTGDEQEQLDLSHVYALQGALDEANDPDPATESVAYQEAAWSDGEVVYTAKTEPCILVESSTTAVTWNAGWYAVSDTVTIAEPITVSGEVHLILTDGCVLNAEKGIVVTKTETETNSLAIYAQSENGGTLNATGDSFVDEENYIRYAAAGIGGSTTSLASGSITIHGGVIHATGGDSGRNGCGGAGIGGGANGSGKGGDSGGIIIFGGTVTAQSGSAATSGAGIGGGGGSGDADGGSGSSITIYGGSVTATSHGANTSGAGIGGGAGNVNGGSGNVTIRGGIVRATGGKYGAGIGGGSGGNCEKSGDGTVTISGGEVTAVGGNSAAGIGGGAGYKVEFSGSVITNITGGTGTVTITGGIVDASSPTDVYYADYEGAPIGNGGNTTATATVSKENAIVFENGVGTVCGDVTFNGSYDVPAGYSLHIPANASLSGNGTLSGGGTFTTEDLTENMISVPEDLVYTGADLTETIKERTSLSGEVTLCGKTFTASTEGWELKVRRDADLVYTVQYNRTNPVGMVSKSVPIARRSLAGAAVRIMGTFTYTGSAHRPEPFVVIDGNLLAVDRDYTVEYKDNINAGTATVTVTGKGNYKDTVEKAFPIEKATLTASGAGIASGAYGDPLSRLTVGGLTVSSASGAGVTGRWALAGDAVPDVGDSGKYTATFIPTSGAENYNPLTVQVTLEIAKAATLTPKAGALEVVNKQELTYTYGLGALRPDVPEGMSLGSAAVTYELGTVSLGSYYDSTKDGAKIEGQTLTLPIEAVESNSETGIGTITVTIHTGNYEDMTATINVRSVNKTVPTGEPTLSTDTLNYGQTLSAITLSGSMQDNGTSVPGTFAWSSPDNRPAVQEKYAAAWTFTPTDNGKYAIVTGTALIRVLPAPIAGAVIVLEPSAFRYQEGKTQKPSITSVTLNGTELTADVDYTAQIPEGTNAGTYAVTLTGKGSYTGTATAVFRINPVEQKPLDQKDDGGHALRLEVESGLSTVPDALKNEYDTPAKIESALRTRVAEVLSNVGEQIAVFDVTLQYKDGSGTWHNVGPDNFPANGVTAILPYPAGTGATGYTFTVQHLISSGDKAGTMETLAYELTADGLRCRFSSLSPVAIGYQAVAKPNPQPNPEGGSGGGEGAGACAVAIEKTEHGKVTSNRASAGSGSTVTLTVSPDSGYVLDVLTVTDSRGNAIKLTAQGGGRYAFTMPGRAVTVKAVFAPLPDNAQKPCDGGENCPSRGFTDLGGVGTWYHEAVDYVLRNGLMNGYGSGSFGPGECLSRAQFAQILFNREGRPAVNYLLQYGDVAQNAWYTEAVRWAASRGIIGGYGNGVFGPNDSITREQLAVMLWRYAGSPAAADQELPFTDADKAGGYALEALRWAVENGVVSGKDGGILDPQGPATRAQAAQMLKNYWEGQSE